MIPVKEKLLIRPYQQRHYENHRKKIHSATPVIDTKAPIYRSHVVMKLKKLQKEKERSKEIEQNNLHLMKKLNYIMNECHWLDNYRLPPPTEHFLNRVELYPRKQLLVDFLDEEEYDVAEESRENMQNEKSPKTRKSKCLACSHLLGIKHLKNPNDEKTDIKKAKERKRSHSVPSKKLIKYSTTPDTVKPQSAPISQADQSKRKMKQSLPKYDNKNSKFSSLNTVLLEDKQKITFVKGSLKLSVKFPSDTVVKLNDRKQINEKKLCNCLRHK